MNITYLEIDSIKEAVRNPRRHDLDSIAASIRRFGFRAPLVLDDRTGRIVAGHGRLSALRRMFDDGETRPAGIVQESGTWAIPVLQGMEFENEQEAEAYLVADNRLSALGTWDEAGLHELLDSQVNLDGIGYTVDDIEQLLETTVIDLPLDDLIDSTSELPAPDSAEDDEFEDVPDRPAYADGEVRQIGRHTIVCSKWQDYMASIPDESIDSIVTDPPYAVAMDMGKQGKWDRELPGIEWAKECLRVLKPGGHIIAFGATRTIHRLTCAIEDAGFEIRDTINWLYWTGFPKSLNISKAIDAAAGAEGSRGALKRGGERLMNQAPDGKRDGGETWGDEAGRDPYEYVPESGDAKQWDGWGTALKPAQEPCILARKPVSEKTVAANVLKHGTGGLNIDACRIPTGDLSWPGPQSSDPLSWETPRGGIWKTDSNAKSKALSESKGRWPANIFMCPKPARSEKDAGLDGYEEISGGDATNRVDGSAGLNNPRAGAGRNGGAKNFHSTVKSVKLMRWLLRLVTPPGGIALDTFLGSGTTMVAAEREGFRCIGVEMSGEFAALSEARVLYAVDDGKTGT